MHASWVSYFFYKELDPGLCIFLSGSLTFSAFLYALPTQNKSLSDHKINFRSAFTFLKMFKDKVRKSLAFLNIKNHNKKAIKERKIERMK